ncbi:hypothetical protein CPB85DRAFT_1255614 [Mucidula mucida]|nr:hypothetical protein CPB85DRAFT_1255614 [Mucidula mucida]
MAFCNPLPTIVLATFRMAGYLKAVLMFPWAKTRTRNTLFSSPDPGMLLFSESVMGNMVCLVSITSRLTHDEFLLYGENIHSTVFVRNWTHNASKLPYPSISTLNLAVLVASRTKSHCSPNFAMLSLIYGLDHAIVRVSGWDSPPMLHFAGVKNKCPFIHGPTWTPLTPKETKSGTSKHSICRDRVHENLSRWGLQVPPSTSTELPHLEHGNCRSIGKPVPNKCRCQIGVYRETGYTSPHLTTQASIRARSGGLDTQSLDMPIFVVKYLLALNDAAGGEEHSSFWNGDHWPHVKGIDNISPDFRCTASQYNLFLVDTQRQV